MRLFRSAKKTSREDKAKKGDMPKASQKLWDYFPIYEIKEGGMGIVYIIGRPEGLIVDTGVELRPVEQDMSADFKMAVKTFKGEFFKRRQVADAFIREAEIWVKLGEHPNIVNATIVIGNTDNPYIMLEYVDGGNLRDWMQGIRLKISESLDFASQFCSGMSHAYREIGMVHQDIKPENVMITKEGQLKITDFGLAKAKELVGAISARTPAYASPEHWLGQDKIDTRSDIYSFGVMIYEMLTGRLPFQLTMAGAKVAQDTEFRVRHLTEKPVPPSAFNPSIPAALDGIVMKCLEKDPPERFQTFDELKRRIDGLSGKNKRGKRISADKEEPSDIDWHLKGISYKTIGKYEEAIIYFDKAIEGGLSMSWGEKADCLFKLNKPEEALHCYNKALEIDPNNPATWMGKGDLLVKLQEYKDALSCFNRAIQLGYEEADYGRKICLKFVKDIETPVSYKDWADKGNAAAKAGQFREAIDYFDKVLEIKPNYIRAWIAKADCLVEIDEYEEAVVCLDNVLRRDANLEEAWEKKGYALANLERYKEAVECYDGALELNPNNEYAKAMRDYWQSLT